jgi:type IV pilus assembly protein PilX
MFKQAHRAGIPGGRPPRREEGVVLMIALIVLVAMTLAGIGMIRSIDTGTMVAGNISFRQSAVAAGDSGIEAAITWLQANPSSLTGDITAKGYYSTRQDSVDLTGNKTEGGIDGVNWDGTATSQVAKALAVGTVDPSTGNQVYYIIHRLCSIPGTINAPAQSCATSSSTGTGSTQDAPTYDNQGILVANRIYYRITSKVVGPKNTVSYVQAVILL